MWGLGGWRGGPRAEAPCPIVVLSVGFGPVGGSPFRSRGYGTSPSALAGSVWLWLRLGPAPAGSARLRLRSARSGSGSGRLKPSQLSKQASQPASQQAKHSASQQARNWPASFRFNFFVPALWRMKLGSRTNEKLRPFGHTTLLYKVCVLWFGEEEETGQSIKREAAIYKSCSMCLL